MRLSVIKGVVKKKETVFCCCIFSDCIFFPYGSGEEIYKNYLGLPLIYLRKVLGVLVIQTVSEDASESVRFQCLLFWLCDPKKHTTPSPCLK